MGRQYVDDIRRSYYLDATVLDQNFLDTTFTAGETQLELIVEVSTPTGTLYFSDRPKYVNGQFYEPRIQIPKVERKISELLSPSLTFSEIEIVINNVDGLYNNLLVGGANYTSFFGQTVELKVGIGDIGSTYKTLFKGFVHYEGSVERASKTFILRARDEFERLNVPLPLPSINTTNFPSAPADSIGKLVPMVLGDWEAGFNFIDGPDVDDGSGVMVQSSIPDNLYGGTIGYNVGGGFFVFSIGNYTPDTISDCLIKRGDKFLKTVFATSPEIGAGFWVVEVEGLATGLGSSAYVYQQGDLACIKVRVPYTGGQYSNAIRLAKEMLKTLVSVPLGSFDSESWDALAAKTTPASGALANILARIWIGDGDGSVMERVIGLLKQVRCDLFIDNNRKLKLRSLHLEDFPQLNAVERIEPLHVLEQNFKPEVDRRNFFNAAAGNYAYTPIYGKTLLQTAKFSNTNSITKSGKEIAKAIDLPFLYVETDVINQIKEYIRFYSAGLEYITGSLAWPHLLRDLGEFLTLTFSVGSVNFSTVPVMVRSVAVDPQSSAIDVVLLSFANLPYPEYQPEHQDKMLSAYDQTIS